MKQKIPVHFLPVCSVGTINATNKRFFDQIMDCFKPVAHAKLQTELQKTLRRQSPAARHRYLMFPQVAHDFTHAFHVARIALVIAAIFFDHARICRAINVIHRPRQRRNAASDEHFAQSLRCRGEVAHGTKSAIALAKNAPRCVTDQLCADRFRVTHDIVGAEMFQVIRLCFWRRKPAHRLCGDRRGQPGAALIEQYQTVFRKHALDPARVTRRPR